MQKMTYQLGGWQTWAAVDVLGECRSGTELTAVVCIPYVLTPVAELISINVFLNVLTGLISVGYFMDLK